MCLHFIFPDFLVPNQISLTIGKNPGDYIDLTAEIYLQQKITGYCHKILVKFDKTSKKLAGGIFLIFDWIYGKYIKVHTQQLTIMNKVTSVSFTSLRTLWKLRL